MVHCTMKIQYCPAMEHSEHSLLSSLLYRIYLFRQKMVRIEVLWEFPMIRIALRDHWRDADVEIFGKRDAICVYLTKYKTIEILY